uniref:HEAT repeat-containing protein 1 n=1 Tax=Culicoides sonorensis TaxID=179676 RepID=A0A336KP64_CULSO
MSTSLAEQLRRLQTPQTAALHDRKKFPSLLFDPKEAAEKDRETIFEIGLNGLEELIQIDPGFLQFRDSLFDKGSVKLERSIENTKTNEQLTKIIRSFMFHLSPYFMLQPAHKCLEWLIRRFRIQDYNKNEFMSLILPYHETRVAVRCIQTMHLKNPNDTWHWLLDVKKSGEPLSRQAIINHAVSSPRFLEFIGNQTYEAVKELKNKASNLQVMFNFYCITTIATIDEPKVKEEHFHAVFKPVTRGFESSIMDFSAASFMIVSHMITKIEMNSKFLEKFALLGLHPSNKHMVEEAIVMIMIMFQNNKNFNIVSDQLLEKLLECKWLTHVLDGIYRKNLDILSLIVPLMKACFNQIQNPDSKMTNQSKVLCEALIQDLTYNPKDAEILIKTVLESYVLKENSTKEGSNFENSIIELDSDEEMDDNTEKTVTEWYSNFLRKLERQYPGPFDKVVQEIVSSKKTKNKKNALKNVLDFFLRVSCSQDEGNMFEYLYDVSSERRTQAVKYVVANFDHLSATNGGNNLLKTALTERFDDDEPSVIIELFKLEPGNLLKIMPVNDLLINCGKILTKCLEMPFIWGSAAPYVLSLIIQRDIILGNEQLVMLLIFPFLTPTIEETKFKILDGKKSKYSIALGEKGGNVSKKLVKVVQAILDGSDYFPGNIDQSITAFEKFNIKSEFYSLHKAIYLINGLKSNTDPIQGQQLLDVIKNCVQHVDTKEKRRSLILTSIELISKNVKFNELDTDLSCPGPSLQLKLSLFHILIMKFVTAQNPDEKKIINEAFKKFLNVYHATLEEKLEFMSIFFTADCLIQDVNSNQKPIITPQMQFYVMKMTASIIKSQSQKINFTNRTVIRYIMALTSNFPELRQIAFEIMTILNEMELHEKVNHWKILVQKLVERKEELAIDKEQLPLILFTVLGDGASIKKQSDKKVLTVCLGHILDFITSNDVENSSKNYEKSKAMILLKHIKNPEILEKTSIIGSAILECCNMENLVVLGKYESMILKEIIPRINKDTIKVALKEAHLWNFILTAMKSDTLMQSFDQKSVPIAQDMLEMFDNQCYKAMSDKYRKEWFKTVIETSTFAHNLMVHTAAGKMLKEITVEAEIVLEMLENMKQSCRNQQNSNVKDRRRSSFSKSIVQPEMLQNMDWKKGVTILEFMQTKLQVDKPFELVPTLFELLKRCLEVEEQSLIEYEKQLILTGVLNCCKSPIPVNKQKSLDKVIKIDLIIECVRATQNPQTHHDALILLSHVTSFIPEQVLHNIVGIFTFMGSSVARHDDTYSFQIMSKVIENVIPILAKHQKGEDKVISVLKIFSDIILDVAMHRRLLVYTKLIQTLGANQYLWQFLAVLFESHVIHYEKDPKSSKKKSGGRQTEEDSDELPERLEIGLSIAKQFSCETVVNSCTNLIQFLSQLPLTEEEMKSNKPMLKQISLIFDIKNHTYKQLRFYKYATLQFLNAILTSHEIVKEAERIQDQEILKSCCSDLIAQTLKYIPAITKASGSQTGHQRYWKIALSYCFDILESTVFLLTPDMFIETVKDLIDNHEMITVKMKIIEMLITKLQTQKDYFNQCGEENLIALLIPLTEIIKKIGHDTDLQKNASISEHWALQQLSLSAIKLLSRMLAENDPNSFKDLLKILSEKLLAHETICDKVLGTLVLCVAELCSTLKVQAISYLPKIMPVILKVLDSQNASKPDLVLLSIVAAISKIVESLVQFLSPYLTQLIIQLSRVYTEALACTHPDVKVNNLLGKMKTVWHYLATNVPSRVIIPAINGSYKDIVKKHSFRAVGPVMDLVTECFDHIPQQEFATLQNELSSFFVKALQFRCDRRVVTEGVTEKDMEIVEEHVIRAFTALILKLSESSFRPLYFKIHNWALVETSASRERGITFFKLSNAISEALKGLFVLFASDLIEPMSKLLKQTNATTNVELYYETPEKNLTLIEYILKTLKSICINDTQKFMNAHRFGLLMEPLANTVTNSLLTDKEDIKTLLRETIGSFTVAVADDSLWKQLNLYLLEKMRGAEPELKIYILQVCLEIARRLGEDYLQLLPETIPFFAELMESDDFDVERSVQRALQELETIVGEDLQKYF